MAGFIQNIIWNSVEGFVEAGTRTAGQYAGDALIRAGDMIENTGRGVGTKVENAATGYGSKVSGQAPQKIVGSLPKTQVPNKKALPSVAKRPAGLRSNSTPSVPTTKKTTSEGTKKTPINTNKYPGRKQIGAATSTAMSTVSTASNGAKKATTGPKALPKPYNNSIPYPSAKATGDAKAKAANTANTANDTKNKATSKELPKPYPQTQKGALPKPYPDDKKDALPKPYPSNSTPQYPGTERKTAVKPGQKSTFESPDPKPYPGTTTYPGTEKKTPVTAKKYKPLERMSAPAEKGKMTHITVGGN